MSQDIDNLVETSLNLGVISLDESGICLRFSLRSSVGAALKNLKSQINSLVKHSGQMLNLQVNIQHGNIRRILSCVMTW